MTEPADNSRKFTNDIVALFLERLASREETITQLHADASMPSASTVRRWRTDDSDFAAAFARALEARAEARMARIEEIGRELKDKQIDPHGAKVLIDIELKLAAKEHPGKFGEKNQVEVSGVGGKPIEIKSEDPTNFARRLALIFAMGAVAKPPEAEALPAPSGPRGDHPPSDEASS